MGARRLRDRLAGRRVRPGGAWQVTDGRGAILTHPGRAIPPVTMAVHHIIDADVAGAPPFRDAAPAILRGDFVALAAHRASFEQRWCTPELTGGLPWICTWKCALRLWPDAPSFSNQVLRYWRMPAGLDRDLGLPVHRAGPDAYVTAHHLRDMLAVAPRRAADRVERRARPAAAGLCRAVQGQAVARGRRREPSPPSPPTATRMSASRRATRPRGERASRSLRRRQRRRHCCDEPYRLIRTRRSRRSFESHARDANSRRGAAAAYDPRRPPTVSRHRCILPACRTAQTIVAPPSITKLCPVVKPPAFAARNTAMPAISSGTPMRRSGAPLVEGFEGCRVVPQRLGEIGLDQPGADRVDPDVGRPVFGGEVARELHVGGLRDAIGADDRRALAARRSTR